MIQNKNPPEPAEILLYQTEGGQTRLEVAFREETCWLSLNQLAELFQRDKSVISRHIKNIFNESELARGSVVAKFATTAVDGKTYQVDYFNLDERNHIENPLLTQLDGLGWGITALMQDLLTGKVRVIPLLEDGTP